MEIYLVIREFYQEPSIEIAFLSEEKARQYADNQNKRYDSKYGWSVDTLYVEE